MNYRKFLLFDIMGGILWICSMTLVGYFLGEITWVKENNSKVVLGIVFLSVLPMLISFAKSKMSSK